MIGRSQIFLQLAIGALLCFASALNGQDKKPPVPTFKIDVDTVFLRVVVADTWNRNVTGLDKEDFRIYEDNIQQDIVHFSQQSAPVSVGFVFDISGSMGQSRRLILGQNWFSRLLKTGDPNPDDEYFLITFNEKINLTQAFTHDRGAFQGGYVIRKAGGWTALYDAVYRGLDEVRKGKNEKKALIVISDGEENSSRYALGEVRRLAEESDVQIYAIGVAPQGFSTLKAMAELTGGRAFRGEDLDYYISLIHTELRNQYLIGYIPSNSEKDGKWRRIRVQVNTPAGYPKLKIHAREGYRALKF